MVLNEFSHQKCTEANSYQNTISLLRPRKPHMVPTHLPATSQLDDGPSLYYVSTGLGGGGFRKRQFFLTISAKAVERLGTV